MVLALPATGELAYGHAVQVYNLGTSSRDSRMRLYTSQYRFSLPQYQPWGQSSVLLEKRGMCEKRLCGGGQKAKVKACYPKQVLEASRVQAAGHSREVLEDVILAKTLSAWTEGDIEEEIREGGMTMKAKIRVMQP